MALEVIGRFHFDRTLSGDFDCRPANRSAASGIEEGEGDGPAGSVPEQSEADFERITRLIQ